TLRGSADRAVGTAAVQVLTAWASANRLVLGQQKVDPRSNEITAVLYRPTYNWLFRLFGDDAPRGNALPRQVG
ncbi:MAG: hypothetical protein HC828_21380, partial [Blastochloris sp.]|nr:hypothetical protein [Blastochloris sp.]